MRSEASRNATCTLAVTSNINNIWCHTGYCTVQVPGSGYRMYHAIDRLRSYVYQEFYQAPGGKSDPSDWIF